MAMQFPIFSNKNPELKNLADYVKNIVAGGGGGTTTVGAGNPEVTPNDQAGDTYWNSTDNNFWVFQNGWTEVMGTNGRRTIRLVVYANGAMMPIDPPAGTSTYNWLDGTFSEPTTPNGWTIAIPTPIQGQYLWGASIVYSDTDVSNTSEINWANFDVTIEAISYAGANGPVGANGNSTYQFPAYYLDTQTPTVPPGTPTGGSWFFGDGTGTAPTGNPATEVWSLTPPGGAGQLYASYTTASTNTVGTPVTNLTWSSPVAVTVTGARGQDGQSIFLYQTYQVSANAPTTPEGGMWNFGTRIGTPPTGWSNSPQSVTGNLYNWVSQAVAFSATPGGTWTGDAMSWSAPVRLTGTVGATGAMPPSVDISGYTALYKDAAGGFTPASVTLTALIAGFTDPTYSWAVTGNGIVIDGSTTGPSVTFSVTTSATLSQANVSLRVHDPAGNDITKTLILPVVEQGAAGTAGQNGAAAAYPSIYQWTQSTTAPNRPTTISRFNWLTGTLGDAPDNTLNNNWSYTLPANTIPGYYLWELTLPLSATAPLTTTDYNWANSTLVPRVVSYNGADGEGGSGVFQLSIPGATVRPPTNEEFMIAVGRLPVMNDLCTVTPQMGANNAASYQYLSNNWVSVSQYFPGSMIVQNTITADRLIVDKLASLTANIGMLTMTRTPNEPTFVAYDKDSTTDLANTGFWLGADADGNPGFILGSPTAWLRYTTANGLQLIGAQFINAAIGNIISTASTQGTYTYTNETAIYTQFRLKMIAGGQGGGGVQSYYYSIGGGVYQWAFNYPQGSAGGNTTASLSTGGSWSTTSGTSFTGTLNGSYVPSTKVPSTFFDGAAGRGYPSTITKPSDFGFPSYYGATSSVGPNGTPGKYLEQVITIPLGATITFVVGAGGQGASAEGSGLAAKDGAYALIVEGY